VTEIKDTRPSPSPVDGFINGLPVAVTQRSSQSAELAVIAGIRTEGEK
jgi:hypothetical protein